MNLAYRDIRHGFGRFILTCIGLGLLLGVVLAMIGIYRGLVVDALTIARAPAVDLWIVEANTRGPTRAACASRSSRMACASPACSSVRPRSRTTLKSQ